MPSSIVFLAWSRLSRRTRELAEELGAELVFIEDRPPYLRAWSETGRILRSKQPRIVVVQLPQGPLLWRTVMLAEKIGFKVVADVHTGFIYTTSLPEKILNRPFHGLLRRVDLIAAHNPGEAELIIKRAGVNRDKVIVVYDPIPPQHPNPTRPGNIPVEEDSYILVPASWSVDEPLDVLVEAFKESNARHELAMVITGNPRRNLRLYRRLRRLATSRVVLTGYLPGPQYAWLLRHARIVAALTTRDYTMLSAIWEAIAYRKPFIASRTRTLIEVVGSGYPCFANNTVDDLRSAIDKCIDIGLDKVSAYHERLRRLSTDSIKVFREKLWDLLGGKS